MSRHSMREHNFNAEVISILILVIAKRTIVRTIGVILARMVMLSVIRNSDEKMTVIIETL